LKYPLKQKQNVFVFYFDQKKKAKYFFISIKSSFVCASDDSCWRLVVERDLTIIFSRVDEPIEADKVNEENKYWAFTSWFRKYSIQ